MQELRFKNHVFVNEDSELQYDHLLQGLVCNKLGAAAVSLDEQRERGLLPQAGAGECWRSAPHVWNQASKPGVAFQKKPSTWTTQVP